ncbi:MAG: alanine--tRNA ligase [Candidatus Margulisiibacteriota bacterium]
MLSSAQIRQAFIDFFASKGHTFAKGSPVVPQDDPTILFTNAGMNQFKDVFLDKGTRPYSRAVNSQVCIRVSGKHNDLEDVGLDTTHLTLFEMLGNWSFGDFYKKEAISWAWELFTQVFKLPKDKLYATVYKTDEEAEQLWKTETDMPAEHVLRFGEKDNFWEMGEVGPCGPCSELHLDRGPAVCDKQTVPGHECSVNGDCARFIELWNLVFIQYNRQADGNLLPLPKKHVDTGAGLERLVAVLQGTTSNYETDLFTPIIQKIEAISGIPYTDTPAGMPHRVMADHIRMLVFSIADNAMPSNEGRGYVVRRLLRRALRYAKQLGIHEPVMHKLVDPVVAVMGDFFEDLKTRQAFITSVIESEEKQFLKTLENGLSLFDVVLKTTQTAGQTVLNGDDVFKLYDTYGFPVDLTALMARENGMTVDMAGFEKALEMQRERSRQGSKATVFEVASASVDTQAFKDLPLHLSDYTDVAKGGEARIVVDPVQKMAMARHHTGTHLLQAALQQVLGAHVHQAGSLVDTDRLRFDFTHFKALSDADLTAVETLVNDKIQAAIPVTISHLPLEEAKAQGAMALFGEKYDDVVRVVTIGDFSKELCGGTHVLNSQAVEQVKLVAETAVAAGVRRIEALAGAEIIAAYESEKNAKKQAQLQDKMAQLDQLNQQLVAAGLPAVVATSQSDIGAVLAAIKQAEKQVAQAKSAQVGSSTADFLSEKLSLNGFSAIVRQVADYDMGMLRELSDNLVNGQNHLVVVLASEKEGKGLVLVRLTKDLSQLKAADILTQLTAVAGGSGGGRPDMAQAGGADPAKLQEALGAVKTWLKAVS